jgi:hypothetical protein
MKCQNVKNGRSLPTCSVLDVWAFHATIPEIRGRQKGRQKSFEGMFIGLDLWQNKDTQRNTKVNIQVNTQKVSKRLLRSVQV